MVRPVVTMGVSLAVSGLGFGTFSSSSGGITFLGDSSSSTASFTRSWQAWRFLSASRRRTRFRLGKIPNTSKKRSSCGRAYSLPVRSRPLARSSRNGRSGCGLSGVSEKTYGSQSSERSTTVRPSLRAASGVFWPTTRPPSSTMIGSLAVAWAAAADLAAASFAAASRLADASFAAALSAALSAGAAGSACVICPPPARRAASARAVARAPGARPMGERLWAMRIELPPRQETEPRILACATQGERSTGAARPSWTAIDSTTSTERSS